MLLLQNKPINITAFPNGESKIDISAQVIADIKAAIKAAIKADIEATTTTSISLTWHYENDGEIFQLIAIKDHLDGLAKINHCQNPRSPKPLFTLFLPYIPYSRMDRSEGGSVFTLKTLTNLINQMNFDQIITLEAHSDVSLALLQNTMDIQATSHLASTLIATFESQSQPQPLALVYPDAGAQKRYGKQALKGTYTQIFATKHRNFQTGDITNVTLTHLDQGPSQPQPFTAIIMDDLCSKGWTFKFVIDALIAQGATAIYLVVTHLEPAVLEGPLLHIPQLKLITATNSLLPPTTPIFQNPLFNICPLNLQEVITWSKNY